MIMDDRMVMCGCGRLSRGIEFIAGSEIVVTHDNGTSTMFGLTARTEETKQTCLWLRLSFIIIE
jgi:hypothetical protein